ncbi:MAG: UPF0502 protein [Lysobacterales bacterium]|jgi:uncharacterized protein YceH (UPF0502 family)|nr:MAG: UPF0502 protein [Xanthomonadales bacterium]
MSETLFPLHPHEARALAVLVEKEHLTPEQYPLTANAVMLACNQKSAREPVMNLSEGEVGHALRRLEDRGLVQVVHGARALRYRHRLGERLSLPVAQRVALAILILRGPQTVAELMAHAERLHRFADVEEAAAVLDRLARRDPPLAVQLPRAAGQREPRFAHRLCGDPAPPGPEPSPEPEDALAVRIARLEQRLSELERRIAELLSGAKST